MLFVVVNGVPSVAVQVMVGSGRIEAQPTTAAVELPTASVPTSLSDNDPSRPTARSNGATPSSMTYIGLESNILLSLSWLVPALVTSFLALLS